MKNQILVILSFFAIFSIISCNNNSKTTQDKNVDNQTNQQTSVSQSATIEAAKEGKVMFINKKQFIDNIYDYEKNPEWTFKSELPCVIDFYADWCKPCKMISPFMEELAQEYKGKVHFLKINVDVEEELARQFNISSIPAVMYCPKNGKPQMNIGGMPKEEIKKLVESILIK